MRLYLVQHGQAKSEQQDPTRPLDRTGRQQAAKTAEFLRKRKLPRVEIWHSDKARARQTAQVLADALNVRKFLERDDLAPDAKLGPVRKAIKKAKDDVMIVGHLPYLSKLASALLTGKKSRAVISFQYAGVVCLEQSNDGDWCIAWMVTPELL
jgi:phosphohistidine phosphatase